MSIGAGPKSGASDAVDVAVVVPVLADTAAVRGLFAEMQTWSARAREVVIVAGAADDELQALCARAGHRCVLAEANRGVQLDRGARETRSAGLWFLHADARPARDALLAVSSALDEGSVGGCLTFSIAGPPSWRKTAIAAATRLRVRAGGTPYGDQALFASRAAYFECGGFPPEPLFEEPRLVRRLRARGRFTILPERVAVSPRRWERDGWFRRSLHNRWLALRHACGTSGQRLARAYGPPAGED